MIKAKELKRSGRKLDYGFDDNPLHALLECYILSLRFIRDIAKTGTISKRDYEKVLDTFRDNDTLLAGLKKLIPNDK